LPNFVMGNNKIPKENGSVEEEMGISGFLILV
jgi:hypothetical protein